MELNGKGAPKRQAPPLSNSINSERLEILGMFNMVIGCRAVSREDLG